MIKYKILRTDTADSGLRKIILSIAENFGVETALEKLDVIEPFGNLAEVPETCEIAMRTKNEEKYLFILNYEKTPASVKFLKPMKDLWTDNTLIGEVELEPYGVLVAEVL